MQQPRFPTGGANIIVSPSDVSPITVGEVVLGDGQDTIWVRVTSKPSGGCPWPWSYGLVSWVTEFGRELGTVKVNGVCEGEIFRLFVGLPPSVRTGTLQFEPRSYNLAWIKLGNPWELNFQWGSGVSSGGGGSQTLGAVANSFVDTSNNGLSLVRVNFP